MYFVLVLVVPNLTSLLAASQDWFHHLQPWVDLPFSQTYLFEGVQSGTQWAQVATSFGLWVVLPGFFGLRGVMRSEVK